MTGNSPYYIFVGKHIKNYIFKYFYVDIKISRNPRDKHKKIHTQTHHSQDTESKKESLKSSKRKMTHDTPGTNIMINGWLLIRDNGGQKADEWHIQSARGKKKTVNK